MTEDRLTRMITAQLVLQQEIATDPTTLKNEDRIDYLRTMMIACMSELHEAINETSWKPWAKGYFINEDAAFNELRDAFQFLVNMMLAVKQCSPEQLANELESALYDKHAINYERHHTEYDGVSSKCPNCKRDFYEITMNVIHHVNGRVEFVLCECEHPLDLQMVAPYLRD